MRSIKEYKQNNSDITLQSILGQSLWYARCCILSVSLMSGFGIPYNYDKTRMDDWTDVASDMNIRCKMPQNMMVLRAVYKKGKPEYCNTYNGDERDYRNFMWDSSTFKKTVTPSGQSYLILDEIMLAKYFHKCMDESFNKSNDCDENMATALMLVKSAAIQSRFMSDNLRNYDGLFIPKNDISQNPFGDAELEEDDNIPDVSDQALSMKAFSMTSRILSDERYPLFYDEHEASDNKKWASELYYVFQDSPDDVFEGKTRDLCNIISACIEYYKISPESDVLNYITKLSLELESRIDMSGNLLRLPYEGKLTSNASCFGAIKTLIEAYRLTGIEKFMSSAVSLYKRLDVLWNPVDCLYALDEDDKYKYTSRDVGSVIAGLNSLRLFETGETGKDAEKKLVGFFNSAVNASKLVQSTMPLPDADGFEGRYYSSRYGSGSMVRGNICHPDIPQSLEISSAPVFAKKFTFKSKKHTYDINSSSFYSEYSLYAANEMLQMNYPEIECFHEKGSISSVEADDISSTVKSPENIEESN